MAGLDGDDTSSTVYIDDLNPLNPDGDDPKSQGDNHARFIKRVLKNTFPNVTGPVTLTQTQINQAAFPSGTTMLFRSGPTGTPEAAPTGWQKVTDSAYNDHALRVVTGTPTKAGSVAFSTLFGRTATDAFTLTSAHIPSHTHTFSANTGTESADHTHSGTTNVDSGHVHTLPASDAAFVRAAGGSTVLDYSLGGTSYTGQGLHQHTFSTGGRSAAHYHSVSGTTGSYGSSGGHTHGVDMRVRYVDIFLATKD